MPLELLQAHKCVHVLDAFICKPVTSLHSTGHTVLWEGASAMQKNSTCYGGELVLCRRRAQPTVMTNGSLHAFAKSHIITIMPWKKHVCASTDSTEISGKIPSLLHYMLNCLVHPRLSRILYWFILLLLYAALTENATLKHIQFCQCATYQINIF